ncbi:tetratricopeptide repeat protein [Kordia sp. YSTF-M3]|uniref:Tetratricopeptide repeat protein n=1 Tax=Kordia aestuariivivens TaxID=2759037 RepID=A0ABR7Q455_9FLAO|nr:tetratricopeptide repeat protein [Kordia aestuariivivens]MBC8753340.1 tetratricopeptide repeat protein [Kordia aestuariivivens]
MQRIATPSVIEFSKYEIVDSLNNCAHFLFVEELIGPASTSIVPHEHIISAAVAVPSVDKNNYHNNIGLTYVKQGKMKLAYSSFSKHEKLFPDDWRTYRNRSLYYSIIQDIDKALDYFKKAVEKGFIDFEWYKKQDSFMNLTNNPRFQEILSMMKSKAT